MRLEVRLIKGGSFRQQGPRGMRALFGACVAAAILTLSTSAYEAHEPLKMMDLTWTEADANGFPLNPDWAGQSGHPHGSSAQPDIDASVACNYFRNGGGHLHVEMCTTQPVEVDERRPFRGVLPDLLAYACRFAIDPREQLYPDSVHGHINWQVATYTGAVSFDDFQDPRTSPAHPKPGDGDLDFVLKRPDHRGYVAANALQAMPGIVLEANRHELGALDTPWWKTFREAFERVGHSEAARPLLHEAPAVAIGLLGIDTKHGAHTELHPLYALFARTSAPGVRPEHWVYFARDRGYEGACSMHQHFLQRSRIAVRVAGGAPLTVPLPVNGKAVIGEVDI
jgi:hypothetical protein